MWIYTRYGAFSVVTLGDDTDTMQVRARRRDYLEELLEAAALPTAERIETPTILETPTRDYRYRILLPAAQWVVVADHLMKESLDYPDFKSHLYRTGFFDDHDNHEIYTGAYSSYVRQADSAYTDSY